MKKAKRIGEMITPQHIAYDVQVSSKKRALEFLSELLAKNEPHLTPAEIFSSLVARERLGATSLGKGVAIPHGRFKEGDKAIAAFLRLKKGVDFDALDEEPVDILFGLLVPETDEKGQEEYLQLLAQLAEMLSDPAFRGKLRHAKSREELFDLITHWKPSH